MNEQLPIPTFFATHAFALGRLVGSEVIYDEHKLELFSELAHERIGKSLPPLHSTSFVFRYSRYGTESKLSDEPFRRASPGDRLFIPADQLTLPIDEEPAQVTKAEVEANNRKGFELRVADFQVPIIAGLAETLAYPPPEDHVMNPSSGGMSGFLNAWGKAAKEALSPTRSVAKNRKFIAEATRQFSGAIILQRQVTTKE